MTPGLLHAPWTRDVFEFLLTVSLGVALISSFAWLVSRSLTRRAPLRHCVLLSALLCCLALPVSTFLSATVVLTFASIPLRLGIPADSLVAASQANASPPILCCPAGVPSPPAAPTPPDASPPPFIVSAAMTWMAGAGLMLVRLAKNCAQVVRLRRTSPPLSDERLGEIARGVAAELGLNRTPLLLTTRRCLSPLAVGFGRRAVILPHRLLGAIDDDQFRDVLAHEFAHLRRGHQWTAPLQELAAALYWPIVPVHALNRALRRAGEELCDDAVLERRPPIDYGETLLRVAQLLAKARSVGVAVSLVGGELERRVARLVDPRRHPAARLDRATRLTVACLFAALSAAVPTTRVATEPMGPEPRIAPRLTVEAPSPAGDRISQPSVACCSP